MIKYFKYIPYVATILFSSLSFAGYDEFACRSSGLNLKNTQLECVSCGIQKYYGDRASGREIVPSEKWLTLLGTIAVQHAKLDPTEKNNIASNSVARTNYQILVLSMLKDYGFCQHYISRERAKNPDPKKSDIAPEDWDSAIYLPLTRNSNLSYDELKKVGKYYGFDDSFFGLNSAENMNYLMLNTPDPMRSNHPQTQDDEQFSAKYPTYNTKQLRAERRPSFVKRLKQALKMDYDVSGEKKANDSTIIASGDKDNGITECLKEIERMHQGIGDPVLNAIIQSPAENSKFCNEVANACDISAGICGNKKSAPGGSSATIPGGMATPPPPPPAPPASSDGKATKAVK